MIETLRLPSHCFSWNATDAVLFRLNFVYSPFRVCALNTVFDEGLRKTNKQESNVLSVLVLHNIPSLHPSPSAIATLLLLSFLPAVSPSTHAHSFFLSRSFLPLFPFQVLSPFWTSSGNGEGKIQRTCGPSGILMTLREKSIYINIHTREISYIRFSEQEVVQEGRRWKEMKANWQFQSLLRELCDFSRLFENN